MALVHASLGRLLPGWCVLCNSRAERGLDLCQPCRATLPRMGSSCHRCALPLPGPAPGAGCCGACLARPPFARAIAGWHYAAPVSGMIQRVKFEGQLHEATVLATLLAELLQAQYRTEPLPQLIVPVPLHWRRLLRRGHNQAGVVASVLGRLLDLPVAHGRMQRRRHTPPQTGRSRTARRRNLAGAFAARRALPPRIALVDDVMTTGATLKALAGAARSAGASEIHVWLLARTPAPLAHRPLAALAAAALGARVPNRPVPPA
jgi:ComF family protein